MMAAKTVGLDTAIRAVAIDVTVEKESKSKTLRESVSQTYSIDLH